MRIHMHILNIKTDSFEDSLNEALLKVQGAFKGKKPTDAELREYVRVNHDKIVDGIESALLGIIYRMENPPKRVEKPLLSFNRPGGKINLWVLDAHEYAILSEHRSFHYYAGETASLIYEEKDIHGHRATEYSLNNPSTWEWIQKHMEAGIAATCDAAPPERAQIQTALVRARALILEGFEKRMAEVAPDHPDIAAKRSRIEECRFKAEEACARVATMLTEYVKD